MIKVYISNKEEVLQLQQEPIPTISNDPKFDSC